VSQPEAQELPARWRLSLRLRLQEIFSGSSWSTFVTLPWFTERDVGGAHHCALQIVHHGTGNREEGISQCPWLRIYFFFICNTA
jgi:hypothetical protein